MSGHSTPQDAHVDFTQLEGYKSRWLGLLFICVSLLVISLDNTILNVALPSISNDLGASASDLQWLINAYSLIFACLLLTMGAFADRIGRKRVLQFGLIWFGIGSVGAALSNSTEMLIGARAFLGVGAAMIMPATLSLVTATFPPSERPQAIGIWAATFGLGVGIGPVVGGWLIEQFHWNSVFFVNLPVIAVALIGGQMFLMNSKDETAPPPDYIGVLLSVPGLFSLIYAIIKAGEESWTDSNVLLAFGAAVVLLGIFGWWENRNPNAMLPLGFFKNMSFTGANAAIVLIMFSMFGSIFFLTQYLQSVQGYTALETGVRIIPMSVALVLSAIASSSVASRIGVKYSVALGIFIAGIGIFIMSQVYAVDSTYTEIILPILVLGVGMGIAMTPATDSIMGSVPPSKSGVASAMNDTTRELGGALGIAVMGTLMNAAYLSKVDGLAEAIPLLPAEAVEAIRSSIQGAHIVAAGVLQQGVPGGEEIARLITDTANNGFVNGMTEAMLISSFILFGASLLTLVLLPNRVHGVDEVPTEVEEISAPEIDGLAPSLGAD